MRPDDRLPTADEAAHDGLELPFDATLEGLDAELAEAGAHARRRLSGRTQPTRVYSVNLRAWLLGALAGPGIPKGPRRIR